ncbi:MAG TPA: glycosyltransferase family 39 protein [Tepidisphaeraceae bacterium]|nr:glycosyltransferase family 39 protein [Tepidisphaeraceae bacterium]
MAHGKAPQLLFLILFFAALTGLAGLTSKDIESWDEGVYYTEARFVVQSARVVVLYAAGKVFPRADFPDLQTLKQSVTGLAPQMGRPVNVAINSVGLALLGQHPWVPALLAALQGLGCIYLVFLILRREVGETAGLLGAFMLSLSPYFLPYRRLGMCEAAGAFLALLTVYLLLRWWGEAGRLARRHSWWLGILCGLSFGANTRTLLLLPPIVLWRMWCMRGKEAERWWLHGLRVAGGFALMIALYQMPYILVGPLSAKLGSGAVEDYVGQLRRFATAQSQLGRVGLAEAYGAPAYFFLRNEGPAVVLFLMGLGWMVRAKAGRMVSGPSGGEDGEIGAGSPSHTVAPSHMTDPSHGRLRWVLPSLLVLPMLQTAVLIPFARYQSWLLPIFAAIAGIGLWGLWQWGSKRSLGVRRSVLVAALVIVAGHGLYRGLPVIEARSLHPAALQWCHAQGATALVDTNMSAALAAAPLYRLDRLWQMPVDPAQAADAIVKMNATGKAMVIVETQQYMKAELLMTPEEYERSAAAVLSRSVKPVWEQQGHLSGLFPFLCFEHNRILRQTLRTLRRYEPVASQIRVYDGPAAVKALRAATPTP